MTLKETLRRYDKEIFGPLTTYQEAAVLGVAMLALSIPLGHALGNPWWVRLLAVANGLLAYFASELWINSKGESHG
jgi:hypothetical protein